jgi:hypothetical protein
MVLGMVLGMRYIQAESELIVLYVTSGYEEIFRSLVWKTT